MRYTLALMLGLGGCASRAEPVPALELSWAHAVAWDDCAPWDGPAISVLLSEVPPAGDSAVAPYLHLSVYTGAIGAAGVELAVGEDGPRGAAALWCPTDGACTRALGGRIRLEPHQGPDPLRGSYELRWSDGRRIRGHFAARRESRRVLCG